MTRWTGERLQRLHYSTHAHHRMRQMDVGGDLVRRTIGDATMSWTEADGYTTYVLGDYAVVVNPKTDTVVTVLYHRQEQWER